MLRFGLRERKNDTEWSEWLRWPNLIFSVPGGCKEGLNTEMQSSEWRCDLMCSNVCPSINTISFQIYIFQINFAIAKWEVCTRFIQTLVSNRNQSSRAKLGFTSHRSTSNLFSVFFSAPFRTTNAFLLQLGCLTRLTRFCAVKERNQNLFYKSCFRQDHSKFQYITLMLPKGRDVPMAAILCLCVICHPSYMHHLVLIIIHWFG